MVLNNLLDLGLKFRRDDTGGDLLEESILGGEMATEFGFPFGDLVDGDGIELLGTFEPK